MNTKIVNFRLGQITHGCSANSGGIPMNLIGGRRALIGSTFTNHFFTRKLLGTAIVFLLLFRAAGPTFAQSVVVNPGSVADVDQLNFGDQGSANFGSMGELTIDVTNSLSLLGSSSGYVNVVDGSGNWLVQNMPVLPYSLTGSDSLSMPYDITGDSDGTQVTSENLRVVMSTTPQLSAPAGTTSSFTMSEVVEDAGGVGPGDTADGPADDENLYEDPGAPGVVSFSSNGVFGITYETSHQNVQAAKNQCAPAAIANDLTWLKTQYGTPISQSNNPGIGPTANSNTLVGVLDNNTGRQGITSRTNGFGVWPLNGTLSFIQSNNLQNAIGVSYASVSSNSYYFTSSGGPGAVNLTGTNNYSAYGITAMALGTNIGYAMFSNLLYNGYAVAIDEAWPNRARHYVQVLGVGLVENQPYMILSSDLAQTPIDPTDQYLGKFFPSINGGNAGFNSGIQISWMNGNQLTSLNTTIDQVIALQSIPEPSSLLLAGLGVAGLWWQIRRKRSGRRKSFPSPAV